MLLIQQIFQPWEKTVGTVIALYVKMKYAHCSGGLHEAGMNTEIISARRQQRFFKEKNQESWRYD